MTLSPVSEVSSTAGAFPCGPAELTMDSLEGTRSLDKPSGSVVIYALDFCERSHGKCFAISVVDIRDRDNPEAVVITYVPASSSDRFLPKFCVARDWQGLISSLRRTHDTHDAVDYWMRSGRNCYQTRRSSLITARLAHSEAAGVR